MDGKAKADDLVQVSLQQIEENRLKEAEITLRQASAICSNASSLEAAWRSLKVAGDKYGLLKACRTWLDTLQDNDGKAVLTQALQRNYEDGEALEAFELLLSFHDEHKIADKLTGLLMDYHSVKLAIVNNLIENSWDFFEQIFRRGDLSSDGLISVLIDQSAWKGIETKVSSQKATLQCILYQLKENRERYAVRAMKAACRLLAVNAGNLYPVISTCGYNVIFDALDIRSRSELRSYAILSISKLLEAVPDKTYQQLMLYVKNKIEDPTSDKLTLAFSAAGTIFPLATEKAINLFLSPGFVSSLVPLVEIKRDQSVYEATLEMLNAACADKTCREEVSRQCKDWLLKMSRTASNEKIPSLASLILLKLKDDSILNGNSDSQDEKASILVAKFQRLISSSNESERLTSIEGLAYASLQPRVKEILAKEKDFLKHLVNRMNELSSEGTFIYGALSTFSNLVAFPPTLSEKQKKMLELKAYANASKPVKTNDYEKDSDILSRCRVIIDAGIVPILLNVSKTASLTVLSLIAQILLSLSKDPISRGLLAQQGTIKLLISMLQRLTNDAPGKPNAKDAIRNAAQALARILISVNPNLIFQTSNSISATSVVRQLVALLTDDPYMEERDLLPTFEALLALTNLASTDDATRDAIVRLAWTDIENLLLSNNSHIQRASTELLCNLVVTPQCVAKLADGSSSAKNRLRILLALADMDDYETRRAAGGALAMLSEWDAAANAILNQERGMKTLLGLCAEDNNEMKSRGIHCIHNIVLGPPEVSKLGKQQARLESGTIILRKLLRNTHDPEITLMGAEALKAIV